MSLKQPNNNAHVKLAHLLKPNTNLKSHVYSQHDKVFKKIIDSTNKQQQEIQALKQIDPNGMKTVVQF
ncbi:hypothetical protein [Chitinophaga filiformis]|uniref:Uncharacterized protein n=1 Tax=Chitinophaga filiformis TaxID=104663 RepID=A0ABY4HWI7_CHIFI|nr:hypothetical protein [Chitinophaga filiformis]UPK67952.1 hypothetical protein MYF79_23655 [Chitinophaga filiformis]